jgi:hypothetical protein
VWEDLHLDYRKQKQTNMNNKKTKTQENVSNETQQQQHVIRNSEYI